MPPGSLPRHPAAPAAQLQAATPETSQAKVLRTQGCSLDAHGWLSGVALSGGGSSVQWGELCPVPTVRLLRFCSVREPR